MNRMSSVSGSPTSSATIGRTRSFFIARAVTCVGNQPVLAIPTVIRNVASPSDSTRGVLDLETRRRQRLEHGELGVRRHLGPEKVRGRVRPRVEIVPAAELDGTELGVVERVPVDVADGVVVARCSSSPPQDGERLASVGPVYQKSGRLLVPVAAATTSQNSVVQA